MIYIANAISLTMFPEECNLFIRKVSVDDVKDILSSNNFISAIGHEATANILSKLLNVSIPTNRIAIKIDKNDILVVFSLKQRLPEGKVLTSTEEIEQIGYDFYIVGIFEII